MTSKGTSRLMATWTGAISNRLNACGLVLGKPSSSQLRSADDRRFSSPPTIFNISSSGTSCPFETNLTTTDNGYRHQSFASRDEPTYLFTRTPRSVFSRIMLRNTSPLDMCSMSNDRTMRSDTVPLPEPGAPMIRACSLFILARTIITVNQTNECRWCAQTRPARRCGSMRTSRALLIKRPKRLRWQVIRSAGCDTTRITWKRITKRRVPVERLPSKTAFAPSGSAAVPLPER